MSGKLSAFELEREANIAKNRELLRSMNLLNAASALGLPTETKKKTATKASKSDKAPQPKRERKRRAAEEIAPPPRRTTRSTAKPYVPPNETPEERKQREAEEQVRLAMEAERKLVEEEEARRARLPRHHDLDLAELTTDEAARSGLGETLGDLCRGVHALRFGDSSKALDNPFDAGAKALKKEISGMVMRSFARVTKDRIYSAAYHPEKTKDLVFFGDKHGMLGIWDALAPADEVQDEDGDSVAVDGEQSGRRWQLQAHWPATSRSSISSIKMDPIDAHGLYTSAYDCTVRHLSFTSGISREVFSTEDGVLISCVDLNPNGHEMWIADAQGGVTRLDLRQDSSKAHRYQMTVKEKIGSVSINPTTPHFLLGASNDRTLRLWDTRMMHSVLSDWENAGPGPLTPPRSSPIKRGDSPEASGETEYDTIQSFMATKKGKGLLRGQYAHDKSVSSAYWDPAGRRVVSTSYDDHLRIWDIHPSRLGGDSPLKAFEPAHRLKHDCQTGAWVTVFRAQWSPNVDEYPHFTVGNMDRSVSVISGRGELLGRLYDSERVTAVQAVTVSHPKMTRIATGNATGKAILWAKPE